MHSPKPLCISEILKVMPIDKDIAQIYNRLSSKQQLESPIEKWGDAISWN